MGEKTGLLYETETYAILGAAFEVYTTLGCGFLERVYQESLAVELALRNIPFTRHPRLPLSYKSVSLTTHYSPDFLCFEKIVLELKSTGKILSEHRAQLLNYLHAGHYRIGLLLNFGHFPKLEFERIVLTHEHSTTDTTRRM